MKRERRSSLSVVSRWKFWVEVLGEVSNAEDRTAQVEMAVLGTRAFIATRNSSTFGALLAYDVEGPCETGEAGRGRRQSTCLDI